MASSFNSRLGNAPEEGIKAPCVVASSSNITLTGEQTISSIAVVAGDRVLVAGQTDSTENGIYNAATGAWSRANDWNDAQDVVTGQLVFVPNALYEAVFTGDFAPGTSSVTFTSVADSVPNNATVYELTSDIASNSHPGIVTGHTITTKYSDGSRLLNTGADWAFTGTTSVPDAGAGFDTGYVYDADGKQFQINNRRLTLRDWGAKLDGVTDDTAKITSAISFDKYVEFNHDSNCSIQTALAVTDTDVVWKFNPGAYITIASGITVTLNGNIDYSNRSHLFRGDGVITFGDDYIATINPEWIGVMSSNNAATNKTAWDKFISNKSGNVVVYAANRTYNLSAPLNLPQELYLIGQGFRSTHFVMSGTNVHGTQCVRIDSGSITEDTGMLGSCTYLNMTGIHFDCSNMTFTGGSRRFMFYGVGLSSSNIFNNRFQSPNSVTNQMDGMFFGPSRGDESISSPDNHHGCLRVNVYENRISNYRDGIIIGRHDATWSESEPASGGAGDFVGGECYENTFGPRNILLGSDTLGATPRIDIGVHYYDWTTGTVAKARQKPYMNHIHNNTMGLNGSPPSLTSTIGVTNGSTTVTGTGFLTDLPTPSALDLVGLSINDGSDTYVVRVASVTNDTTAVLSENWPGLTNAAAAATLRRGARLYCGSGGILNKFSENYTDQGCFSIYLGANCQGAKFIDNFLGGAVVDHILDLSDAVSRNVVVIDDDTGIHDLEHTLTANTNGEITLNAQEIGGFGGGRVFNINVDTFNDQPSGDLETINGGKDGDILVITAANSARDIVAQDTGGNIKLNANRTLTHGQDTLTLSLDGASGNWYEVGFGNNA